MTKRTNTNAKLAMRNAWSLARKAQTLYGGTVHEFLSEALRIAWRELLANPLIQEFDAIIREIRAKKAAGTFRMGRQSRYRASYYAASW